MEPNKLRIVIALLLFGGLAEARAEIDKSLAINLGLAFEENATRSSDNEESDVRTDLGLTFSLAKIANNFSISTNYGVRYSAYVDDAQDERTSVSGSSSLNLFNRDKSFSWTFENRETETLGNTLLDDTPDNRQRRSTFSTGPTFSKKIGKRNTFSLSGLASVVRQERDGADSDRYQYNLSWERSISSKMTAVFSAIYDDVEATDIENFNYQQSSAQFMLSRVLNGGNVSLQAGYSEIDLAAVADTKITSPQYGLTYNSSLFGGATALAYSSRLLDRSIGGLGVLSEPSSQVNQLEALDELGSFNTNSLAIVNETQVTLGHTVTLSEKSDIGLTLSYSEYDYEKSDFWEERQGLSLSWNQGITEALSLNIGLRYNEFSENNFDGERSQERAALTLNVQKTYGKSLLGSCGILYGDREGDVGRDYDGSQFSCSVSFTIF